MLDIEDGAFAGGPGVEDGLDRCPHLELLAGGRLDAVQEEAVGAVQADEGEGLRLRQRLTVQADVSDGQRLYCPARALYLPVATNSPISLLRLSFRFWPENGPSGRA